MIGFLRGAAIFVGAMFLQWWWNTHFAYWGAAPQFLLVLTILLAARRGPVLGMLAGFGWGLYLDVARAELFGASALILTLAAYFVGVARRRRLFPPGAHDPARQAARGRGQASRVRAAARARARRRARAGLRGRRSRGAAMTKPKRGNGRVDRRWRRP